MTTHKRNGFTLAELMVVVAIIGLLVAILLPTLDMVFSVVRERICAGNLHQIRVAVATLQAEDKISKAGGLYVRGVLEMENTILKALALELGEELPEGLDTEPYTDIEGNSK